MWKETCSRIGYMKRGEARTSGTTPPVRFILPGSGSVSSHLVTRAYQVAGTLRAGHLAFLEAENRIDMGAHT